MAASVKSIGDAFHEWLVTSAAAVPGVFVPLRTPLWGKGFRSWFDDCVPLSSVQAFAEISTLAAPQTTPVLMKRAVVLGGSMAGLLAARVLSDHAEEVLLIERDASDLGSEARPGVPQGSHVHALLPTGAMQLERWFPGFNAEAAAAGVVVPPADGSRARMFFNGVARPPQPMPADIPVLISTRPFLEYLVRARTLALANVKQVAGRTEGLVFHGDRVTGARYVPDGGQEAIVEDADLVVDATGRSSKLSTWLEDNGWPRPPMLRMPIKVNYATAMFEYDEKISDLWTSVATCSPDPATGRLARQGGVNRVEGDRWIMLVAGYGDDRPTRDREDYVTRCRRDFPEVYGDIAERGTMLGEVITYHQADSRRRDFHKLDRFPAGLVAAGDAIASFNPVYGQGMTSATLHASSLSQYLRSEPSLDHPAMPYFDLVRVVVDAAWHVSTFADLELPHVDGPYPRAYKVVKWFRDHVNAASEADTVVGQRLASVNMMMAHPNSLANLDTLLRTVRSTVFKKT